MNKFLEAFCGVVLLVHILDATSTDYTCTFKIYLSSSGFSCYPCLPGFKVLKECQINGTTNICIPCQEGYFQPTCSKHATMCKSCGSCPEPERQTITRNCTRTQDTTCACTSNYSWDSTDHFCTSACSPGKKITEGGDGEYLCVSCEAGTFSNSTNSYECQQCSNCSSYKKVCDKTSDAVCNKLTTETPTTTSTLSSSVTDTSQNSKNCKECDDTATIVLSIILCTVVLAGGILFIVLCKKYRILPCSREPDNNPKAGELMKLQTQREARKQIVQRYLKKLDEVKANGELIEFDTILKVLQTEVEHLQTLSEKMLHLTDTDNTTDEILNNIEFSMNLKVKIQKLHAYRNSFVTSSGSEHSQGKDQEKITGENKEQGPIVEESIRDHNGSFLNLYEAKQKKNDTGKTRNQGYSRRLETSI